MKLSIDSAASSLRLQTRAKGLLAKLAHDLAIDARDIDGSVDLDGETWSADLEVAVSGLQVVGVLRSGVVKQNVLSAADTVEIERKIRDEVLVADKLSVAAEGDSLRRGQATVRWTRGEQRLRFDMKVAPDQRSVELRTSLSLAALRVPEVKGPLGAFKIADAVEVVARLALREQ